MAPYILRVLDREWSCADPSVSETVLSDVQMLFEVICRNIVKGELRLRHDVPDGLMARASIDGEGALAHDARRFLDETLDYLGGGDRGTWMSDTYPDVIGRKAVASAVLDLHRDLNGCVLVHGDEGSERGFSDIDIVWVTGMAHMVTRAYNGGLMGIVVKDPARRDHWALYDGRVHVPLSFESGISRYDVEDFSVAGPLIAKGTVMRDEDGRIVELRAVENCYSFPGVLFLRGISDEGDVGLVYPLEAVPSYYARTGKWFLKCQDLGLEASADDWDDCVIEFHRRFVRLWRSHADGTAEDNARMHELLDRMCPFDR